VVRLLKGMSGAACQASLTPAFHTRVPHAAAVLLADSHGSGNDVVAMV
jgi:hypothetical protein